MERLNDHIKTCHPTLYNFMHNIHLDIKNTTNLTPEQLNLKNKLIQQQITAQIAAMSNPVSAKPMPAVEQIQAAMNIATKQASSNSETEGNENKNFGHGQNNLIGGKRKNSGSHSSVDLQDAYSNHLSKKLRLLLDNSR